MDQYSIVNVIGKGSFGRALLVQPINEEQNYVMKEIRLPKILKWFAQMCLGTKHIHDKRVLHRDLKSKIWQTIQCVMV
ncbi:hypothetical protein cypCar_00043662 [Cyprinus carpio]|nr:hypothetical protein cypCar_00043662 [Cyprinus carpio]